MAKSKGKKYDLIIEDIFNSKYKEGVEEFHFERNEIEASAKKLEIATPKNLGDVIYSYKFRSSFPQSILERTPLDKQWVIKNMGKGKYMFKAVTESRIIPDRLMMKIKIPDATPGIVQNYALSDEQALLTKVRYNRLLDIFSGITCYSLQNHLRTSIKDIGQVETDEIYVGVDKKGKQYVFPVQAKGGNDQLGVVQIEQDIKLCQEKYPNLICKAIAAQFIDSNTVAMFEFALIENEVQKVEERHYLLVDAKEMTPEDVSAYNSEKF